MLISLVQVGIHRRFANTSTTQEESLYYKEIIPSRENGSKADELDSSNIKKAPADEDTSSSPNLDHVLDDLNSFDMIHGLASKKDAGKKPSALHKHHKKPQRKKDRSWRVGHDDDDGMPVAIFQKPVNTGSLKAV